MKFSNFIKIFISMFLSVSIHPIVYGQHKSVLVFTSPLNKPVFKACKVRIYPVISVLDGSKKSCRLSVSPRWEWKLLIWLSNYYYYQLLLFSLYYLAIIYQTFTSCKNGLVYCTTQIKNPLDISYLKKIYMHIYFNFHRVNISAQINTGQGSWDKEKRIYSFGTT